MFTLMRAGALSLTALALSASLALAQQTPPAPDQTPAPDTANTAKVPTQTANPTLAVATVKLENGSRASKLIGATVYDERDQQVGSIDDLILTNHEKVVVAIVSVGGFLGIGSKLVAIPYDQFRIGQKQHVVMPGASKEALNAMPSFTYGT